MRRGLLLFLSFSAAIFLAVYALPVALLPWLALGLGALLVPALLLRRQWAVFVLLGAALGCLWFWGYRAVAWSPAEALDGRRAAITIHLDDYPERLNYNARVTGYVTQPGQLPVKTLFYGSDALMDLAPGDQITVTADCSLADQLLGETSHAYTSKGIFLRAVARGSMEVRRAERTPWWCLPSVWGRTLRDSIRSIFPGEAGELTAGVVTGDTSGFSEDLRQDFSRAGVSHVTAVSGMHVCFLVGFLTMLTGWSPKRRAAVCIPVVLLFALAVGAHPSVLRAAFMQTILLAAPLLRREADDATSVAFALFLLLVLDPFTAANIGLQLSFAAVVGIRLFTPRLLRRLERALPGWDRPWRRAVSRVGRFLFTTFATTLGAMVFTVPLSIYYFNSLSLISPLTNLLILPAVTVLFAAGLLLALLALLLPGPAALIATPFAWLARYILWAVRSCAGVPYAAVGFSGMFFRAMVVALYALLLVAVFFRGQGRIWVFLLSGALMVAGSILFTALSWSDSALTVTVLDVGQGQCVVLTSRGYTALVDCGGSPYDSAGATAASYLSDQGEHTIDLLVLTHFHSDHANGLTDLFRQTRVKAAAIPDTREDSPYRDLLLELAAENGCEIYCIQENTTWTLGDAQLTLYSPLGDGGVNEEGLSVLVTRDSFDILITGDMNTAVEERLVNYCDLPDCEVLVAGHHGSRYSNGDVLLDAVTPEVAVISVGYNDYGHPASDTLARFAARDITVFRTDWNGHVTIQSN